jgi:hypothetical protein
MSHANDSIRHYFNFLVKLGFVSFVSHDSLCDFSTKFRWITPEDSTELFSSVKHILGLFWTFANKTETTESVSVHTHVFGIRLAKETVLIVF